MGHITDYGLAATEVVGAVMVLTFARALVLYARSCLRPAPTVEGVVPPRLPWFVRREVPSAPALPAGPAGAAAQPPAAVPVPPVAALHRPAADTPGHGGVSLTTVILATESVHTEETADGGRSLHWSRKIFRRDSDSGEP